MNMNYGTELIILILSVTICSSLSSYCEDWHIDDYPSFVQKLPENAKEEFCELYEKEMDLSKNEFFDLLRSWSVKYSVEEKVNRLIRNKMKNERRYYRTLMTKLHSIYGTVEAKNAVMKILRLQLRMDITPVQIENQANDIIEKLPEDIKNEARSLWNMLHSINMLDDY